MLVRESREPFRQRRQGETQTKPERFQERETPGFTLQRSKISLSILDFPQVRDRFAACRHLGYLI